MKNDDYLVYTNKEVVATKKCGPNQETIQITEEHPSLSTGGCNVKLEDHKIYGEESIRHSTSETRIFDWNLDAKGVLRNITMPQFIQAMRELENEASVISFETEDILQQVDLNSERRESSNLYSWAKWITPLIAAYVSFMLSIFYLQTRKNRRWTSPIPSAPEVARIHVVTGDTTPTIIHHNKPSHDLLKSLMNLGSICPLSSFPCPC